MTNSRGHTGQASTWRRHNCPNCGRAFSSSERPVMADSYRITRGENDSGEPYSRSRLSSSIARSFGHLSGSTLYAAVDWLAESAEKSLITNAIDGRLLVTDLGLLVHEIIKNYDPVAGVQYAAQNGLVSAVNKRKRGRPSLQ